MPSAHGGRAEKIKTFRSVSRREHFHCFIHWVTSWLAEPIDCDLVSLFYGHFGSKLRDYGRQNCKKIRRLRCKMHNRPPLAKARERTGGRHTPHHAPQLTPTLEKSDPVTLEKSIGVEEVGFSLLGIFSSAEIFLILFLSAILGRSLWSADSLLLGLVGVSAGDSWALACSSSNWATFLRSKSFSLDKIST